MRWGVRFRRPLAAVAGLCVLASAAPAWAQDASEAELDALVDAAASPEAALAAARTQADSGDLTGAASTLERALLVQPGATRVRLAYAALLCRLDDRQRAAIEAAKVRGGSDTDAVRAACGSLPAIELAEGKSRDGVRGSISAGLAYDSDAGGALALSLDSPLVTYTRDGGLAFVASAAIGGRASLGSGGFVYGALSGMTHNDVSGPDYDYQAGSLAAGFGTRGRAIEASLGGVVRHVRLSGDPYLTEIGAQARFAYLTGRDSRLAVTAEFDGQNYSDGLGATLSRDGERYDLAVDYQAGGADRFAYILGAAFERKDADTAWLGYRGWRGYGAARAPLGTGLYGTLSATLRRIDYVDAPAITDVKETRWFGRAGLGLPLADALSLEGAAYYNRRDYNAASSFRDYDSVGGELRIVFRFGEKD